MKNNIVALLVVFLVGITFGRLSTINSYSATTLDGNFDSPQWNNLTTIPINAPIIQTKAKYSDSAMADDGHSDVPELNNPEFSRNASAVQNDSQVHVLYTLSGGRRGFMDEFSSSLKSCLLNNPLDLDLTIHIICDANAYRGIGSFFKTANISNWIARNRIRIKSYNLQGKEHRYRRQIKDATQNTFLDNRHTIGAFFRLFAYDVLPEDVNHVIYMDTDVAVLANLQALWNLRNSSLMFQWGETECSGFVMLNLRLMRLDFWRLVAETYPRVVSSGIFDKQIAPINGTVNDQLILRALAKEHPHLISSLPSEWNLHRADNLWLMKHKTAQLLNKWPKAGMAHFNGWEQSEGSESNKFKNRYEEYGPIFRAVNYYGDHPWTWTQYILESQVKTNHIGHKIEVLW